MTSLRVLRESGAGLTVDELAEKSGVSRASIIAYGQKQPDTMRVETAHKLATALGIDIDGFHAAMSDVRMATEIAYHLKAVRALNAADIHDNLLPWDRMISMLPDGALENRSVTELTEMFELIDRAWKDGYAARDIDAILVD